MSKRIGEEKLVIAAAAGEKEAFAELVAIYKDAVFGLAYSRLRNFEDARDAAQETFLRAMRQLPHLRKPQSFGHWLCRIAEGTSLDILRHRKEAIPLDHKTDCLSQNTASSILGDSFHEIEQALDLLGKADRLAIILHYVNGYSCNEIGEFLNVSPGAVRARLCRARRRLKQEVIRMTDKCLKAESQRFKFEIEDPKKIVVQGFSEAASESDLHQCLVRKGFRIKRIENCTDKTDDKKDIDWIKTLIGRAREFGATRIRMQLDRQGERLNISYLIARKWQQVMTISGTAGETWARLHKILQSGITRPDDYRIKVQSNKHLLYIDFH